MLKKTTKIINIVFIKIKDILNFWIVKYNRQNAACCGVA